MTKKSNYIYHLFNPYLFDLAGVTAADGTRLLKTLTIKQFIDKLIDNFSDKIYNESVMRFLLRQGWLDGWELEKIVATKILQDRTQYILERLGFAWSSITSQVFREYLKRSKLIIEVTR